MTKKTTTKKTSGISESIKENLEELVLKFNKENNTNYTFRIAKKFVYFNRGHGPIFRLEFIGSMDDWKFSIYKYSSNRYDPDEWFFPGSECVNGTVEGAMKAGLKAYPN